MASQPAPPVMPPQEVPSQGLSFGAPAPRASAAPADPLQDRIQKIDARIALAMDGALAGDARALSALNSLTDLRKTLVATMPQPNFEIRSVGDELVRVDLNTGQATPIYQGESGPLVDMSGMSFGGEVGTIPQGYELFTDPTTGARRLQALPGGPEDTSRNDTRATELAATASEVVTSAAARARDAASNRNFGSTGTSVVANLPWTDSAEVVRQVDVLKAQAIASNLQAMRDASPTGGALGQVTAPELKLLADKSGALNPNSPTFLRDLADYERTLLETIHGREVGRRIFEETRGSGEDGIPTFNPQTGQWE
jgi:hypothetical protein